MQVGVGLHSGSFGLHGGGGFGHSGLLGLQGSCALAVLLFAESRFPTTTTASRRLNPKVAEAQRNKSRMDLPPLVSERLSPLFLRLVNKILISFLLEHAVLGAEFFLPRRTLR